MKNKIIIIVLLLLNYSLLFSQVAINTDGSDPDNSAIFDVKSTSRGFLPPRMTQAERNAISAPADGLLVFCTDCGSGSLGTLTMFMAGQWYKFSANCIVQITPGTHFASPTQIVWNWNTVTGATGYKWNTANDYAAAIDIGTATAKTETGLTCYTAYTRYVWAYGTCGNSAPVTLVQTTEQVPPPTPTAGTHVSTLTQVVWNWNTVTDATGYKWNTTNEYGTATDMGTATTKTETGLTCNTTYTRYAWAYGACGNSTPVTLTQNTLQNGPSAPTAGTHVPSVTQIIWNWSTVTGATGYKWNTTIDYGTATDMGTATTKTETGLTCNTTYIRYAWAYGACGNSTPVTLTQTTSVCGLSCPGTPTVDYGGKTYNTVLIGSQCWLKENLNIGTRINGILEQTNNAVIEKYCYDDLESNCDVYGGLYQWNEWMNYTTSSAANPSGRQGICPTGWHVPSEAEYCQMETFLDATVNCIGGWVGTDVGGKMKEIGTSHWLSPNTGASNSSGFTGLPGGYRVNSGGYTIIDNSGLTWSATESSASSAWGLHLIYNSAQAGQGIYLKATGYSGRCVKDN